MARVMGQSWCARDMGPLHPRPLRPRDAQARLVMMQHRRISQRTLDLLLDILEPLSAMAHQIDERADRHCRAEDVGYHLAHPRIGHKLLLNQTGAERPEARTILLRGAHARWGPGGGRGSACWAAHMCQAVFNDLQPQRRKFLDLTALHPTGRILRQLVLTAAAPTRSMRLKSVGRSDQRHPMPGMPWLRPPLLAALLPQALGLPPQSVTRRRHTTVVANLRHPRFQLLHACHERLYLLAQGRVLGSQDGLFFWRNAPSLPAAASPS